MDKIILTHTMYLFIIIYMYLADAFIQSDLQCIQVIHVLSVCVPWELNLQPFALLTQCSTTEPQEIVLLAIATNIPELLMTGFVIQGHIWSQ